MTTTGRLVTINDDAHHHEPNEAPPVQTDVILAERGKAHGPFVLHAEIAQRLKTAMCGHQKDLGISNYPEGLTPSQTEALEMIQHKIARILAGDPNHIDHWDDIAGYATLVANILR